MIISVLATLISIGTWQNKNKNKQNTINLSSERWVCLLKIKFWPAWPYQFPSISLIKQSNTHTMTVLMHLLFCRSLSKHLSNNIVPRQLSILVAHLASLSARLLPATPQQYFCLCAWINSLVRLDIGRLSLICFHFDQKWGCTCHYCILFLSSSIASQNVCVWCSLPSPVSIFYSPESDPPHKIMLYWGYYSTQLCSWFQIDRNPSTGNELC